MKLILVREYGNSDDTIGKMYWKNKYGVVQYVHTLEDEYRSKKVYKETRIPDGFYDIGFRREGRIFDRYSKSSIERIRHFTQTYGVPQVENVPNFQYVLIHIGNTDEDTAGCILVGNSSNNNSIESGFIGHSTLAYSFLLEGLTQAAEKKANIIIEIRDFDKEVMRMI